MPESQEVLVHSQLDCLDDLKFVAERMRAKADTRDYNYGEMIQKGLDAKEVKITQEGEIVPLKIGKFASPTGLEYFSEGCAYGGYQFQLICTLHPQDKNIYLLSVTENHGKELSDEFSLRIATIFFPETREELHMPFAKKFHRSYVGR